MIAIENVTVERGGKTVLEDINFKVERGDFVAITGPNGGGKTTLLRVMLKLLEPEKGKVVYYDRGGRKVSRIPTGYLPQKNAVDVHFPVTVEEVVAQGLLGREDVGRDEAKAKVKEALERVGLGESVGKGLGQLSGGQAQRALLARALVREAELLVLDEPLSYLDKHYEEKVYGILHELAERGTTVVVVSHEITRLAQMANRHLVVDRTLHVCGSHRHFVHYDCVEQA